MPATNTAPAPTPLDDRIERCRRVLEDLTDQGMRIVRAIDPHDASIPIGETALAFSRLSRAIRLNLLLDLRLEDLAQGGAAALAAERAQAPEDEAPEAAEPAEPRERPDRERPDRERLDRESPDEALRWLKRPMTDMVAAIGRNLGLAPEAIAEAQAPFAALTANDDGPGDPPAPCRTAGVPPATPPRPRSPLQARLLGAPSARALGP